MTICLSELGNLGHLGNQMFQYAALRGIAARHGYEWAIPSRHEFGSRYALRSSIYEVFELSSIQIFNTIIPSQQEIIQESSFHFDENLFNHCPDNINLYGYFQSYKYFQHINEEIVKDFTLKNFSYSPENYICIHVRRGDYVNLQDHHPTCDLEYYQRAMEVFDGENFLVISDDLNWCRQQEVFKGCLIPDSLGVEDDMAKMINSKSIISANSSFSWWGAWLNKNSDKIIVTPKRWFGNAYSHYDMSDLRPQDWIQL